MYNPMSQSHCRTFQCSKINSLGIILYSLKDVDFFSVLTQMLELPIAHMKLITVNTPCCLFLQLPTVVSIFNRGVYSEEPDSLGTVSNDSCS